MAAFFIKSFGGVSPKTPPRYLQDSQAQVAINCPVFAGSLVPLPDVGTAVTTLTKAGTPQTIYRFGQDVESDGLYWFSWNYDVDVCRGQVSGDPVEWTFYTGDGAPKATYNGIALSGTNLPSASIPLGVPSPLNAPDATPDRSFDPTTDYQAVLVLDTVALGNLTTSGAEISIDNGATYTTVDLSSLPATNRQDYVATQVDAVAGVSAVVKGLTVEITSDAYGPTASVIFRGITAVSDPVVDETTAFTYTAGYDKTATGTTFEQPLLVIPRTVWAQISTGDTVKFRATKNSNDLELRFSQATTGTFASATAFRDWVVTTKGFTDLVLTVYGDCVVVTPIDDVSAVYGRSKIVGGVTIAGAIQFGIGKLEPNTVGYESPVRVGKGDPGTAKLIITAAEFNTYFKGKYASTVINGGDEGRSPVGSNLDSTIFPGLGTARALDPDNRTAYIIEAGAGTGSSFRLRSGTYGTTTSTSYVTLSAVGSEDTSSVAEARVYTYTWVSKIATFEFESGPSDPSLSADVFKGQSVTLSKLEQPTVSGGSYYVTRGAVQYQVTARRIYRSVNGVYLFVAEIGPDKTSFVDELAAEDLSEEMTVTGWALPPANLTGLINMPNGIMAGFVGRDVYFCDPYHPHAWPEGYIQTVDYPVVGLGRMDTTLAVLTKGVPYFIQGSHPDSMVVVKSDIQQACASKRSIVSINGTVLYASPDGLVMLSTAGSKVITDNMFTRAQWQSLNPSSIHAYQHDSKYVAFYDTGTVQGGFMYDMISGQFIFHDIYATAGYNDLVRDYLYLAFPDRTIKKWFEGSDKAYTWRSKIFTMPRVVGFGCAQIEADAYPVTAKFYCDDAVTPYFTQVVSSRNYFRLPVKQGRDFEIQLEGTAEVFAVNIAQAPEELADA